MKNVAEFWQYIVDIIFNILQFGRIS